MASSGSTSVTVTSWDTLKFSWSIVKQDVTNNTSTVSWKLELIAGSSGHISSSTPKSWSATVNGTKYSGKNHIGISNNSTKTLANGSTVIKHDSDGTKAFSYSFSQAFDIAFSGSNIGTKSGSGSGILNTIPRASSLSVSNGTLGTTQTLTINEYSSVFTHTITYKCGSATGTIVEKTSSTSISFTPPLSLASQNGSGTSVNITLILTTYNGSTSIGTYTKNVLCSIPSSVKPLCSISVSDATGNLGIYGAYIQGVSKFAISISATQAYGSSISKYNVTANGTKYSSANVTTGIVKSSGTLTITAKVTDKRGRVGTASVNVSVLAYNAPQITKLHVNRSNADGTENDRGDYTKVIFSYAVTSLDNKNASTCVLKYKKTSETTWTEVTQLSLDNMYDVTDASYIFQADNSSSYDVAIFVTDAFNESYRSTRVSTGFTIMHWLANGLGMGIGKVAEIAGVLDIGFKTRFSGGLLHPILPDGTDLDTVTTPNTYIGKNIASAAYLKAPFTSGTFILEVTESGPEGQLRQTINVCNKERIEKWVRFYYSDSWGRWIDATRFDGTILWSGEYYMDATHKATLSENISEQRNGIVIVFSEYYDDAAKDESFMCRYIPKSLIAVKSGFGHAFQLSSFNLGNVGVKYLYIKDGEITGHANNIETGTAASGITYSNNHFVMRYVIGV